VTGRNRYRGTRPGGAQAPGGAAGDAPPAPEAEPGRQLRLL
jgi:hypothetical protein